MEQTMRRQEQLPGAFSGATTNSQHGRVRWYLVHTPNGKERETCEKVRRIAGSRERAYAPMPDDAQDWYRSVLDDDGVVRNSVARIEDGVLHIEQGPLVGQEARVHKIDRRKRWCLVDVGEGDSAFRELLPLDVPSKT